MPVVVGVADEAQLAERLDDLDAVRTDLLAQLVVGPRARRADRPLLVAAAHGRVRVHHAEVRVHAHAGDEVRVGFVIDALVDAAVVHVAVAARDVTHRQRRPGGSGIRRAGRTRARRVFLTLEVSIENGERRAFAHRAEPGARRPRPRRRRPSRAAAGRSRCTSRAVRVRRAAAPCASCSSGAASRRRCASAAGPRGGRGRAGGCPTTRARGANPRAPTAGPTPRRRRSPRCRR